MSDIVLACDPNLLPVMYLIMPKPVTTLSMESPTYYFDHKSSYTMADLNHWSCLFLAKVNAAHRICKDIKGNPNTFASNRTLSRCSRSLLEYS
jgi:hypothetical protein